MTNVLVVAPHPDDETLGCGGTLLKHKERGDSLYWLIMTDLHEEFGFSKERIASRAAEIQHISSEYGFADTYQCSFPTTKLDTIPMGAVIEQVSTLFRKWLPEVVYLPYPGDIHTDHHVTFDAVASCTKWFRYPSVKRVLIYETLSETDFTLNPDHNGFRPQVFVDISAYLQQKIALMNVFASEMGDFPFPRSEQAIRSLAHVRGAMAGYHAAECFMLLKERDE